MTTPTITRTPPIPIGSADSTTAAQPGRSAADDELTVVAWRDPVIDAMPGAIRTASDDALVWYTPHIGSIGMICAHRFSYCATVGPSTWTIDDIARTFGIGASQARVSRMLDRLERFGIIRRHGHTLAVRLWLPPLSARQRDQLPPYLAAAYEVR